MKIVFFSSNRLEVELLSRELSAAGIPCRVRDGVRLEKLAPRVPETELWIERDGDIHRAFMLCVQRDAGFAKRELQAFDLDDLLPETEPQNSEMAA